MVAADSISTTTKHPVSPMTIVAVSSSSPDINVGQQPQQPSRQQQQRDDQQDPSLLGTDDVSITSSMVDQTFSNEIRRRIEMAVAQAKHFKQQQHQQQKCQTGGDDVVGTTTSTSSSLNGDNEAMSSAADSVGAGTTTNIEIVQSPLDSDSTGSSSASSSRNGK